METRNPCGIDFAVVDSRMTTAQRKSVLEVGNYYNASMYYYENSSAFLYDEFRSPLCHVALDGQVNFVEHRTVMEGW